MSTLSNADKTPQAAMPSPAQKERDTAFFPDKKTELASPDAGLGFTLAKKQPRVEIQTPVAEGNAKSSGKKAIIANHGGLTQTTPSPMALQSPQIELPDLNQQKVLTTTQLEKQVQLAYSLRSHNPLFVPGDTLSSDRTGMRMFNHLSTTQAHSGVVSPNIGGTVAHRAQRHYEAGGTLVKHESIGGISNSSLKGGAAASAFVQSHRISNKIRGHLLAYQQPVPPLVAGTSQMLQPLTKLKSQLQKAKHKGTDTGASRRNQSPLLTTNSIHERLSTHASQYNVQRDAVKQSKTRNNLQSHVVSQNPSHRPKHAVVGQPYINFKKEHVGRHLSTKPKHLDSLERRDLISAIKNSDSKSRYFNVQHAKSNRPGRLHPSGTSIDSDISLFMRQQSSRQNLNDASRRKSSFSYSSNMEREFQVRRPSVWNQRQQQQQVHSDKRINEELSSNCVVNVLGGAPLHNPSSGSFKQQPNASQRKQVLKQQAVDGRQSPHKQLQKKGTKLSHSKNRSTEAIEFIDLPIAILDQEQLQLPQTVVNQNDKKLRLGGAASGIVSKDGEQKSQSHHKKHSRRFSHQKMSEASAHIRTMGSPSDAINNDSALSSHLQHQQQLRMVDGKKSAMTKGDDDDQPQQRSPRAAESISQAELHNLSTYQSQAVVSRQKAPLKVKKTFEQSGTLESENTLTEKTMLQVSYDGTANDLVYDDPSNLGSGQKMLKQSVTGKSALSLKSSNAQKSVPLRQSHQNGKSEKQSVFGKAVSSSGHQAQQPQQSQQRRFGGGRDSQKIIPVLNTRYQNQTDSKCSPTQREGSLSGQNRHSQLSKSKFKGVRNSVQRQPSLVECESQHRVKKGSHGRRVKQGSSKSPITPLQIAQKSDMPQKGQQPNSSSVESLPIKSRFQTKKPSNLALDTAGEDRPAAPAKQNSASPGEEFMLIQQDNVTNLDVNINTNETEKPYTELTVDNSIESSVAIDAPDVLGCELTSQTNQYEESTFNHSVVTQGHIRNYDESMRLLTPSQLKKLLNRGANKHLMMGSGGGITNHSSRTKRQSKAHAYEPLPQVGGNKASRQQLKNFQTMDRRKLSKGILSPTPAILGTVKFQQVSNMAGRSGKVKDKDGMSTLSSQFDVKDAHKRGVGDQSSSLSRASKNASIAEKRKPMASNADSATGGGGKNTSVSPALRENFQLSNNRQRQSQRMKFATNDYCMETSAALSSSVTSFPRIVSEDKSNVPVRAQQRRLGSQLPAGKFSTSKSSIRGDNLPRNDSKQYLSSRLHPGKRSHSNQPSLTPIRQGSSKPLTQVKISKTLKKSTQSSSMLKLKPSDQKEQKQRLPKLKKQVSIRESSFDELPSAMGSNSDSGSIENALRNKLRQGTPMSIIESNADKNEKEKAPKKKNKKRMANIETLPSVKHGKSNSLAANLYPLKNQNILSNHQDSSRDCQVGGAHEQRSFSTTIRDANLSVRNQSEQSKLVGRSQATEDSSLLAATEHQIRIEISKTEVLDSMKKEHQKDLSLLFYDFNNSKARLMSKMKKMADFVIHEEVEADGDGAAAQHPDSRDKKKKKVIIKERHDQSPIIAKQQSICGSEKTKSTLTKAVSQVDSNKKTVSEITQNSTKKSLNFKSSPAAEASSAIKHLDVPVELKSSTKMSSTDVTQNQSGMDFVNKKIDKAKQSISQLQNEGNLKSMSLQSPARLVPSRSSSTNTLQQSAQNLAGTPDQPNQLQSNDGASQQNSPNKKGNKKIFMFNQSAVKENFVDARNRSPCFGSVKGSQHMLPTDRQNSIENLGSLGDNCSQSMSSLRQQSNSSKNTPFPQPQNHLIALSRRSDQSLNEVRVGSDGCGTGATRDLDSTISNKGMVTTQIMSHGMGTGYQTSTTNQEQAYGKKRVNNVTNRRVPSMSISSPPPKNQVSRRKSQDTSNGVVHTESDFAVQSSHQELLSEAQSVGDDARSSDDKVHSVIAYVKENKQIWE